MSQSTADDDDLFGEAAEEIRADVEGHLASARAELPDSKAIWETDADNVLGALNGLRTALDAGDAEDHLRQAKKWYTMGERADAFEDADDLAAAIDEIEELIDTLDGASDRVGRLASTLPELRGALQEAHEGEGDDGAVDGDDEDAEERVEDGASVGGVADEIDAAEDGDGSGADEGETDLDEFEGDGADEDGADGE